MLISAASVVWSQQRPPRQPIPRGTSTIRGAVIDAVTKAPVAGCSLDVNGSGYWRTVTSGADGAYALNDIAAGEYYFNIECPAHLMICIPSILPPTRAEADAALRRTCLVDVLRDQRRENVDFHVIPGAIARGRVVAFDGRPVANANIRLGRGIHGENVPMVKPVKADADGRFEVANAPPGEWRLEVEIAPVRGGLPTPVIYYPGILSWEEATGVELIAGKIRDDLIVTLPRINENTLTIAVPPADATITNVAVSVLQPTPFLTRRLTLNSEGIATLKAVLPGRYFAVALASSNEKQWAGFEVIDFVEDSYESRLQLLPTGSISGRIVTDRGALPNLDGVIVGASWVHDGAEVNPIDVPEAPVAPDGTFRIDGLFGMRKLQVRAIGVDWEVAAIRQGRSDVTDSGVQVVPDDVVDTTIVLRRR